MNIVVLCGGISTEREISIKTGANVCAARRKKGHNAVLVDSYFGIDNPNICFNNFFIAVIIYLII